MKNEYEEKWYETYYSIIFIPPGQVPQHKGAWTEVKFVEEMIADLKRHYHAETTLIVVSSRCGEIWPEDADEWLEMLQVGREYAEEEAAYIKAGVCSTCGACSREEAESKCRPSPLADTGDYSCAGEHLWED